MTGDPQTPPNDDERPDDGADDGGDDAGEPSLESLQAQVSKWKALARKHEADARKGADAQARLQEIEDAKKSAEELLQEQLTAAEQRAAKAERDLLVTRIVAEKGLPTSLAERLRGDTEEELAADADELLAAVKPDHDDATGDPDDGLRGPRERLRSGRLPSAEPEKSADEIVAAIPRDS